MLGPALVLLAFPAYDQRFYSITQMGDFLRPARPYPFLEDALRLAFVERVTA